VKLVPDIALSGDHAGGLATAMVARLIAAEHDGAKTKE
jgi:hypothetical protein